MVKQGAKNTGAFRDKLGMPLVLTIGRVVKKQGKSPPQHPSIEA